MRALAALLLVGCAPTNPWTREAALAPALARLDRDHDGTVGPEEYVRASWRAHAFSVADSDGDGELAVDELDALMKNQDPATLFQTSGPPMIPRPVRPPPEGALLPEPAGTRVGPPGGMTPPTPPPTPRTPAPAQPRTPAPAQPRTPDAGPPDTDKDTGSVITGLALGLLRDEILAKDPSATVPTAEEIAAAASDSLDSEPARRALATLKVAATNAGLAFPPSLAP